MILGVHTVQNSASRVSLEMIGCCFVQSINSKSSLKVVTSLGKVFYNQRLGKEQ